MDHDPSILFPLMATELDPIGIGQLYNQWVNMKLEHHRMSELSGDGGNNSTSFSVDDLVRMHYRLSLDFLFPLQFQRVKKLLGVVNMEEVHKFGFFRKPHETGGAPEPIYPGLADYFLASFVSDCLAGKGDGNQIEGELAEFVMKGALGTRSKYMDNPSAYPIRGFNSFEFKSPGIIYFFDHILNEIPAMSDVPNKTTEYMRKVTHACAYLDAFHIFKYLDYQLGKFERSNNASSIFDSELVLAAISHARLEFVKAVLTRFRQYHHEVDDRELQNILYAGVQRGDYLIMEYLLEDKQLRQGVENLSWWAKRIMIVCAAKSRHDSNMIIEEKAEMLGLFIRINRGLLDETDGVGNPPLHAQEIHARLQIELIRLGADALVLAQDNERRNGTILHMDWSRTLTPEDYHSLVMNIPQEKLRKLVHIKNGREETPLPSLLRYVEPKQETLDIFKKAGALFEYEDVYSADRYCSILGLAIYKGRNVATIKKLIEHGADVNLKGRDGQTLLHLAGALGRLSIAEYLTREKLVKVNAKDGDGLTPLDYVIESRDVLGNHFAPGVEMSEYRDLYKTGLFLHDLGGKFQKEGLTQLHRATHDGYLPSVKLLLHLGVGVNGIDYDNRHGNTPLHTGIEESWGKPDSFLVTKLLLDNGANPNISNNEGEIPFQVALNNPILDFETFRLLQSKSDVRWTPSLGNMALVHLVKSGDVDSFPSLVTELQGNGGDLNFRDGESGNGRSLLHFAVRFGNDRAVRFLVDNGADVNLTDEIRERTPILEVTSKTSLETIEFLIENGADVYARNYMGETFLHQYIKPSYSSGVTTSPSQLHSLAVFLVERNHSDLFNVRGMSGKTPYEMAGRYLRVYKKTLALLQANGVPDEPDSPLPVQVTNESI